MCFPYSRSCYRSIHPSIITSEIKRKFSLSMRVEQKKTEKGKIHVVMGNVSQIIFSKIIYY